MTTHSPLSYHIVSLASFATKIAKTPSTPLADDINHSSPWISDSRVCFPMELGLELLGNHPSVSEIKLTSLEGLTPTKIEIFVGTKSSLEHAWKVDDGNDSKTDEYSTALFKRLGFVKFQVGGKSLQRETKIVAGIDTTCHYVKLVVHEPAMTGNCKVGLCEVSLFGQDALTTYYIPTDLAPSNPSLLVAQTLRSLTDSPPTENFNEMEAALFSAGVETHIISSLVNLVDSQLDEETQKQVRWAEEMCKGASERGKNVQRGVKRRKLSQPLREASS